MDQTLLITIAIMACGLIGCVIPMLPGPPLVWLGALYYGYQNQFSDISYWFLGILLVLAIVGATADIWMGFLGAKKGGASLKSQLAALAGGFVGLLVLSVPGLLIGSVGAIILVEWMHHRDWNAVAKAGGGYLAGYLLATVVEIVIALTMIGLFALKLGV